MSTRRPLETFLIVHCTIHAEYTRNSKRTCGCRRCTILLRSAAIANHTLVQPLVALLAPYTAHSGRKSARAAHTTGADDQLTRFAAHAPPTRRARECFQAHLAMRHKMGICGARLLAETRRARDHPRPLQELLCSRDLCREERHPRMELGGPVHDTAVPNPDVCSGRAPTLWKEATARSLNMKIAKRPRGASREVEQPHRPHLVDNLDRVRVCALDMLALADRVVVCSALEAQEPRFDLRQEEATRGVHDGALWAPRPASSVFGSPLEYFQGLVSTNVVVGPPCQAHRDVGDEGAPNLFRRREELGK
eukprot:4508624-Prymnesium_polylepis.1